LSKAGSVQAQTCSNVHTTRLGCQGILGHLPACPRERYFLKLTFQAIVSNAYQFEPVEESLYLYARRCSCVLLLLLYLQKSSHLSVSLHPQDKLLRTDSIATLVATHIRLYMNHGSMYFYASFANAGRARRSRRWTGGND
jgi:hypothetical protein